MQAALDTLRDAGYSRISVSRNWQEPLNRTKIIAQSGDDLAGAEVQSILGVGEVLVESTGELNSDLTIQIGRDWQKQVYERVESEAEENLNDF